MTGPYRCFNCAKVLTDGLLEPNSSTEWRCTCGSLNTVKRGEKVDIRRFEKDM